MVVIVIVMMSCRSLRRMRSFSDSVDGVEGTLKEVLLRGAKWPTQMNSEGN
jgi:hypothetical protein